LLAAGGEEIGAGAKAGDQAEEGGAGGAEGAGDIAAVELDGEGAGVGGFDADEDVSAGDAVWGSGEGEDLEG
jgi:hypothetical protein